MNLTRTRADGAVFVLTGITPRRAAQSVMWCATDNIGMPIRKATEIADKALAAFNAGEAYHLGTYTFTVTP